MTEVNIYASHVLRDARAEFGLNEVLRGQLASAGFEEALHRYDAVVERAVEGIAGAARDAAVAVRAETGTLNGLLRDLQAERESRAVPYPSSSPRA